jgi:hypothetical protein
MLLADQTHITSAYKFRWLMVIFAIKALLFVYFAHEFYHFAKAGLVKSWIVVEQADSISYYNPAQLFVEQGWYAGICRMPGLLPQYALFAWPLGHHSALVAIIVFQFLFSVLSVFLLAIVASRMFSHRWAFPLTAIFYACSSFVSIWDHTLLSDSFAASSLIISIYFLSEYAVKKHWKYLVLAGFWLTWSIFTRQIVVLFLPLYPLLLWAWLKDGLLPLIRRLVFFATPFALLMGFWIYRNYQEERKFIPLIKPTAECWTIYTPQFMKINELIIAWGEDVQYWIKGTPAEWFGKLEKQKECYQFRSEVGTKAFNNDSIILLQHRYVDFRTTNDTVMKNRIGDEILRQCDNMLTAYKAERAFSYYFTNRVRMMKDFVFPLRLDNTPGPAFEKMNPLQKLVKLGYYGLLLWVNLLGVAAVIVALLKGNRAMIVWSLMPISLIVILAGMMGYIEQRYLVPVYPLFLIMGVYLLLSTHARYFPSRS